MRAERVSPVQGFCVRMIVRHDFEFSLHQCVGCSTRLLENCEPPSERAGSLSHIFWCEEALLSLDVLIFTDATYYGARKRGVCVCVRACVRACVCVCVQLYIFNRRRLR